MNLLHLALFVALIDFINSVELTFELPDNDKQCYYQEIEKNRTAILEYQVKFSSSDDELLLLWAIFIIQNNFYSIHIVGHNWWTV